NKTLDSFEFKAIRYETGIPLLSRLVGREARWGRMSKVLKISNQIDVNQRCFYVGIEAYINYIKRTFIKNLMCLISLLN
ncbi:hypothetical protein, partial [Pseudoalteromonas sp. JB197]|uniref:hypothetical protein n=1 Tax=Pseudoalteromonas sp. JB197 TaxID=1434839 RepID=UPI001C3CA9C0